MAVVGLSSAARGKPQHKWLPIYLPKVRRCGPNMVSLVFLPSKDAYEKSEMTLDVNYRAVKARAILGADLGTA